MKRFLYPLFFVFCFSTGLFCQNQYFQISGGLGASGISTNQTDIGIGGNITIELHRSLTPKTSYFVGLGGQYTNYEDQSVAVPCEFIFGDKVVLYNTSEFYTIHRTDLTLNFGLEYRVGKLVFRGSLLPTIRLADKIDALIVEDFNNPTRPSEIQAFSIKPGERVNLEGPVEYTLDYTDQVQLQGEVGIAYSLGKKVQIGLAYRHGLTQYELQYKTVGICGVVGCDDVNIVNSRVDARTGHGYLTLNYSF
jgi:hypothetical protein